jgi:hypothetical protein
MFHSDLLGHPLLPSKIREGPWTAFVLLVVYFFH